MFMILSISIVKPSAFLFKRYLVKHVVFTIFCIVINRYPAVRIHNPPNLTAIDPLVGLDMQTIVRGFGIFFLPFGTVLCIFTVTGLVGTIRNSHRLKTVVRHSCYFCLLNNEKRYST